jgi:hypothetical protein
VPTSTATPSAVPSDDGSPNRATSPGSEALSGTSGATWSSASRSHAVALDGPAASTPTRVATAADAIPARSAAHRSCTAASSSTGASDGLSATATPYSTAASTGRPRRSAIHPATSAASSMG